MTAIQVRRQRIVIIAACILLAYVFSFGPMAWLEGRGYVPRDMAYIYLPLIYVSRLIPPLDDLLRWQLKLAGVG